MLHDDVLARALLSDDPVVTGLLAMTQLHKLSSPADAELVKHEL